jgi:AraC family transcriptional regulator, transcriptional activator of pobA
LNESLRLETGVTAEDLIRARRILEAKRLLLHSELTMAEIGYELGFEDPSYFARFIRRELKTSPGQLRSLTRKNTRTSCDSPRNDPWFLASIEEPYLIDIGRSAAQAG